jgi:hypothetical protein
MARLKKYRVPGHKIVSLEHNGERCREESAWTVTCECGMQESCRLKEDCYHEHREHRKQVLKVGTYAD